MYVHDLNPIAIQFLNIKIYWYSLAYFFGFILGINYSKYLIRKLHLQISEKMIDDFLVWAVIGVIIGGRLGYVIFYNFNFYLTYPNEILKIWNGGMSFHGGMLGLILSMIIFSFKKSIKFFDFANIISASAPLGIFLGRIANFINGELWGKKTQSNWGVIFNDQERLPRHPSQLYEAFFEGFVLFFLIYFSITRLKNYNACCVFLIFYGFFRFGLEFLREPDSHIGYIIYNITTGQILSIPMILIGCLFIKFNKNEKQNSN